MSVSDKLNTNEQQLLIDGMHCAACVKRVEKALSKVNGVNFASVNLVDQIAFVQGDAEAESLVQAKKVAAPNNKPKRCAHSHIKNGNLA